MRLVHLKLETCHVLKHSRISAKCFLLSHILEYSQHYWYYVLPSTKNKNVLTAHPSTIYTTQIKKNTPRTETLCRGTPCWHLSAVTAILYYDCDLNSNQICCPDLTLLRFGKRTVRLPVCQKLRSNSMSGGWSQIYFSSWQLIISCRNTRKEAANGYMREVNLRSTSELLLFIQWFEVIGHLPVAGEIFFSFFVFNMLHHVTWFVILKKRF